MMSFFFICYIFVTGFDLVVASEKIYRIGYGAKQKSTSVQHCLGPVLQKFGMNIRFGKLIAATTVAKKISGVSEAPQIFVDGSIFDAGIVYDDTDVLTHTFTVTNTGSGELIIKNVKADCSCTTIANDKNKLAPGESLPITVKFRLKGEFDKVLESKTLVFTNDKKKPKIELIMRVERRREFALYPSKASMGVVPLGEGKVLFMRIKPAGWDKRLCIDKAVSSSAFVQVTEVVEAIGRIDANDPGDLNEHSGLNESNQLDEANEPNQVSEPNEANEPNEVVEYLLQIHLLPEAPSGILETLVTIPCQGARLRELKIPVRAEVAGPIETSLSKIQFGLIRQNSREKTKEIWLRAEKPFHISNVATDQPWLVVSQQKISDKEYAVAVKIIPQKMAKGKLKGTVTIETNMHNMNRIEVPVVAFRL
jgi:hypothetical protein